MKSVEIGWLPVGALIIFTFTLFFTACREQQPALQKQVVVFWKEGKATAVVIPKSILPDIADDSIPAKVEIRLAGEGTLQSIAGTYSMNEHEITFTPLIPFTRTLLYEVFVSDTQVHEFQIEEAAETPKLMAIYPSSDTLPENLLKIYLVFSKSMAATHSLQHISLLNQQGDTLPDVFLDLQQELWNEDRTVLTLWMNPGRVKRDLQPNIQMGTPVERGKHYTLIVSGKWKDAEGKSLTVTSQKNFMVGARDQLIPMYKNWKLQFPKAGTYEEFQISLEESMDYLLLKNAITVVDASGKDVSGTIIIDDEERKYRFKPDKPWASGKYRLKIEDRLEDLAGNNLSRPFDRDLQHNKGDVIDKSVFEREWSTR